MSDTFEYEDVMFAFGQVTAFHDALLEAACKAIIDAGYSPTEDCRIDRYPEINGGGRTVLVVRNVPTFAVETRFTSEDGKRILYTFAPEPLAHLDIIVPAVMAVLRSGQTSYCE